MVRRNLNDLLSFVTVAREGVSPRRLACWVTQSALIRRSAAWKRASDQVTDTYHAASRRRSLASGCCGAIGHRFDEIEAELDVLTELRDKPAGLVRITCGDHVLRKTLLPKLTPLLHQYPDIKVEFDVDYGFRDIVADRFDAGVRLGDTIDKDMIAVPIGPPLRMAVVATPAYFATVPFRKTHGTDGP
jgi:hypothetical protein